MGNRMETNVVDTSVQNDVELTPAEQQAAAERESDLQAHLAATDAATATKPAETKTEKPAADEWTPNYKLKVLDQEKEIEEWARPFVTKETQDKFRELYEKAYGLDHVKSQRDQEREARTKFEQNFNQLVSELEEVGEFRSKDLGMFFKKFGLTDQQVADYVLKKAEAMDAIEKLPPHMKTVYNQVEELRAQNHELNKKVGSLTSGSEMAALQQAKAELTATLSNPEIDTIAKQYDARVGKPGAFERLVVRHGNAEYVESQRNLSAREAVNEVIQLLGLQATPPSQAAPAQSSTAKVVTAAKPTVLPNLGAGGATPTAKTPVSSLKELRERAKQVHAGG